ncbi:MAG: sensor histidine kinase [Clostridia bacterium]|nr:sensor histidine kinase [Clostridia bacterium]
MTGKKKIWGIQKKILTYTALLLLLALFLSCVGVVGYSQRKLEAVTTDKYNFLCEKSGLSLQSLYEKTDKATEDCIKYEDVQKSLGAGYMNGAQKSALSKYFSYIDLNNVSEYCYVDNKKNLYTKPYCKISYHDFRKSGIEDFLGDDYAVTKWFFTEDTLFGTGEMSLFVGRYVHNMDFAHEPGVLIFKMDEDFFSGLTGDELVQSGDVTMGIVNSEGKICFTSSDREVNLSNDIRSVLVDFSTSEGTGMIARGLRVKGGMLSAYRHQDSGMMLFVYVPVKVLHAGTGKILLVIIGIYLVVFATAVLLSLYASDRIAKPIKNLSRAMSEFNGEDYTRIQELNTNTELDGIGRSYNKMLGNIEQLVQEVKDNQKELRTVEVNMLISQINPHFLYNTLDTIYMLARINKDEKTMRMIQALSRYLRLSLSKGKDIVTVEDEIENVKNYMEIQQIRNENLFSYDIACEVDAKNEQVLKLILQPLVENAIKYGFCDIYEGGIIRITVTKENNMLVLTVFNNGEPINEEACDRINSLAGLPLNQMKETFQNNKNGYGIVNIITRLRLMYDEKIVFQVKSEQDGTMFTVKVPERHDEQQDKLKNS